MQHEADADSNYAPALGAIQKHVFCRALTVLPLNNAPQHSAAQLVASSPRLLNSLQPNDSLYEVGRLEIQNNSI